MNKVVVIGPTYKTEIIHFRGQFVTDKTYPSKISNYLCGGSYTIAYNLAALGTDTFFITRLSFDDDANSMMMNMDNVNGMIYSNNRVLKNTPSMVYLFDKGNKKMVFNNINFDVHPSIEDGFPGEYFKDTDYGIIDVVNSNYLSYLFENYPDIKWISNNNIPADNFLHHLEGIVLDYDFACTITVPSKFDILAQQLISKGVKWLVIPHDGYEVRYYFNNVYTANPIEKQEHGSKIIGTYESFLSMFVACLAEDMDFENAIEHALNLSNNISYEDDIYINPNLLK